MESGGHHQPCEVVAMRQEAKGKGGGNRLVRVVSLKIGHVEFFNTRFCVGAVRDVVGELIDAY